MCIKWILKIHFYILCLIHEERRVEGRKGTSVSNSKSFQALSFLMRHSSRPQLLLPPTSYSMIQKKPPARDLVSQTRNYDVLHR